MCIYLLGHTKGCDIYVHKAENTYEEEKQLNQIQLPASFRHQSGSRHHILQGARKTPKIQGFLGISTMTIGCHAMLFAMYLLKGSMLYTEVQHTNKGITQEGELTQRTSCLHSTLLMKSMICSPWTAQPSQQASVARAKQS